MLKKAEFIECHREWSDGLEGRGQDTFCIIKLVAEHERVHKCDMGSAACISGVLVSNGLDDLPNLPWWDNIDHAEGVWGFG